MSAAWAKAKRRGWVRTSDGYAHHAHGRIERLGSRCWGMTNEHGNWYGMVGSMTRAMRFLERLSRAGWHA